MLMENAMRCNYFQPRAMESECQYQNPLIDFHPNVIVFFNKIDFDFEFLFVGKLLFLDLDLGVEGIMADTAIRSLMCTTTYLGPSVHLKISFEKTSYSYYTVS